MTRTTHDQRNLLQKTPIAAAVFFALLGPHGAALAQAPTAPSAPASGPAAQQTAVTQAATEATSQSVKLEPVVVSANRRIERLDKVPQSISVLGAQDIERNNVREISDVLALIPSLTISTGTQVGTNSMNMRGIGTTSNNLGIEGDVAIILDDLPFAQPQQAFKDLHDVVRIEVLKGPQSTLFGKSAIAGAVVITTAPIDRGPVKGKLSTYLTSDHEYRVGAAVSGGLSDTVGFRVAASKSDFRGLLHNLTRDDYTNGSGGSNFNAKLEWDVSENLTVAVNTSYSDSKSTGNTSVLTYMDLAPATQASGMYREGSLIRNNAALSNNVLFRGIVASTRNRDVRLDDESALLQKDWTAALRINYLFPATSPLAGHNLISITGFNSNKSNDIRDNDGHEGKLAFYTPLTNAAGVTGTVPSGILDTAKIYGLADIKTSTQELRLVSPDSGTFRYVGGLWYSKISLDRSYLRGIYGIKPTNYTNYAATSGTENAAIYANSTWEFMPNHTLTLGGRYNQETNNYTFTTISALAATAPANTPYTPYLFTRMPENVERAFTGKAAYAYNITPNAMVYTSYSTGRKGVAYDMTSGANNANIFKFLPLAAETAKNVEVGFKANLFENRATLNVAAFQTKFKNFQASSTQTFSDGSSASVLFGIGGIQTQGAEMDFRALITKELSLSASYAYTESTVTEWPFGACYSGRTDCTKVPPNPANPTAAYVNGSGFVMPNAPRHNGTLGLDYRTRVGAIKTGYFAQARSQSGVKGNIDQNPVSDRPGITVVDAGFSLGTADDRYKLSAGVKNLFDKQYSTGGQGGVVGTLFTPTGAASSTNIVQTGWKPARDAFRYYTVRFDVAREPGSRAAPWIPASLLQSPALPARTA